MLYIRKYLTAAAAAVCAVTFGSSRAFGQVSGRVQVLDAGGHPATDLGNAVVYLEGRGPRASVPRAEMALDARQFHPRVLVVPTGTTVNFPNLDPFNHNVFSAGTSGGEGAFDMGMYGHNESHNRRFTHAGLVTVFCNIHPRMVGFIVVRDNPWFAQPAADGSFTIANVPAGTYTMHVWHERAPESTRQITVPAGGLTLDSTVVLDAGGYQYTQHKNKYGQDYGTGAARERY